MGFSREQLAAFEGKTVDDLLGPDVRLLFVGINPGGRQVSDGPLGPDDLDGFHPDVELARLNRWASTGGDATGPPEAWTEALELVGEAFVTLPGGHYRSRRHTRRRPHPPISPPDD